MERANTSTAIQAMQRNHERDQVLPALRSARQTAQPGGRSTRWHRRTYPANRRTRVGRRSVCFSPRRVTQGPDDGEPQPVNGDAAGQVHILCGTEHEGHGGSHRQTDREPVPRVGGRHPDHRGQHQRRHRDQQCHRVAVGECGRVETDPGDDDDIEPGDDGQGAWAPASHGGSAPALRRDDGPSPRR